MKIRRVCRPVPVVALLCLAVVACHAKSPAARAADEPSVYQGPCALAVSPDGKTLFAACADARQVVWVELPGGRDVRRVTLPAEPSGLMLSPDGQRLIVTCSAPRSTVSVIQAGTGELVAAIPAGHTATSPVISPDGRWLYVCNRFDNDVSVIDLPALREVARIPAAREPIAAAVTPDGALLLVANHLPNRRTDGAYRFDVTPVVTVIDTRTHAAGEVELSHGANGLRDVSISPNGRYALVTHLLSNFQMVPFRVDTGWINVNVVSVIDLPSRKVISTIGLDEYDAGAGNPWEVAFSPDGAAVCVSLAGTHELAVIDTSDLLGDFARRTMQPMMAVWPIYTSLGDSLWRRVKLPGQGPRALAATGETIYAAQYFSDNVVAVAWEPGGDPPRETIALGPAPRLTPRRHGELLFHDATICYQQWQSCASCHPDGRADSLNWDLLNDGGGNPKNTKSMLLAHRTPPAMAAGVRPTAEVAVRSGLVNILFADRPEEEAAHIDAYLESLQPVPSPHLVDGRLSRSAERGRQLFHGERIACDRCHPAPFYTDLKAHNVGTRSRSERLTRYDTPALVEAWRTAPYLHDGRYLTVRELLKEGRHGLRNVPGNDLGEQELHDLAEFVMSL